MKSHTRSWIYSDSLLLAGSAPTGSAGCATAAGVFFFFFFPSLVTGRLGLARELGDSSGVYICKSIVNYLRHGNFICKSEGNYLGETIFTGIAPSSAGRDCSITAGHAAVRRRKNVNNFQNHIYFIYIYPLQNWLPIFLLRSPKNSLISILSQQDG